MAFMSLNNINVSYGNTQILKNLNLSIDQGELISLLGPSGCGKTTTLRTVAGFIEPSQGDFILDNTNMTKVPVHKRNFGLVFQSYALFPHLSVYDNIAFGLKARKLSFAEINQRVTEIMKICGLTEFAHKFPKQMSGGQRQRVALARALVIKPKLLLLDEPLSNLDAKLRMSMRVEIKRLQKQFGITTLFVTHDQEECFSISDRVAIMNNGIIEQFDKPENIYHKPKTEFVARFIGFENFFSLDHVEGTEYITSTNKKFVITSSHAPSLSLATIRPSDIRLATTSDKHNVIAGKVGVSTFLGQSYQYEILTELGKFLINLPSNQLLHEGTSTHIYLPEDKLILVAQ